MLNIVARGSLVVLFLALMLQAHADLSDQWVTTIQSPPWKTNQYVTVLVHNNSMYVMDGSSLFQSSNGTAWTLVSSSISDIANGSLDMVSFNGKLWGIPLKNGSATSPNRVVTSTDGKVWTPVGKGVPWIGINSHSTVVQNNKIWVIGASLDITHPEKATNVYSTSDGINWTLVSSSLPSFGFFAATVTAFGGKLWLLNCDWGASDYSNDIWSSVDGRTWSRTTDNPGWRPRVDSLAVVYNNRLWMIGGCTGQYTNEFNGAVFVSPAFDLWSSANGVTWDREPGSSEGVSIFWEYLSDGTYCEYPIPLSGLAFQNKIWVFDRYGVHYSWLPPGPPRIGPIDRQSLDEGTPYTLRPQLTQGTRPVTWSLINPPAGVKFDAATGVVTWPCPLYRSTPYAFRLRATNSAGVGETTWSLTVNALAAPVVTVPLLARGNQTTVTWTAVPKATGYVIQRDDAPDFATPQATVTVNSTTLKYVMTGLVNDKTYWYRVRAQFPSNFITRWSNIASCTQDAVPPRGLITNVDYQHSKWPLTGSVRLILGMTDPGTRPSGIDVMRFSTDRQNWTPWQPYAPAATFWAGKTGVQRVYIQVRDKVGNVLELSTSVTIHSFKAIYVDDDNISGPWDGTMQHPFRQIASAINAAHDGDTLVVAPGRYKECINMQGKNIVLRSIDPQSMSVVQSTIIDGQRRTSTVTFKGTETTSCVLAGLTITNGLAGSMNRYYLENPGEEAGSGGGIHGNHTHATIESNYISGNSAEYEYILSEDLYEVHSDIMGYGGGLYQCDGKIVNNIIAHNAVAMAARSYAVASSPAVSRRMPPGLPIYYTGYVCRGTALLECNGPILNNTIAANDAPVDCSVIEACHGLIRNNIIYCPATNTRQLVNTSTPEYCCLPVSSPFKGNHNVLGDPKVAKMDGNDFRLLANSPCIDAGGFVTGEARDIEGDPRGYDGVLQQRGDGSNYDIGADEYVPSKGAIWMLAPEEGVGYTAGDNIAIHWRTDPAQAGTTVLLDLYCGDFLVANLNENSSISGDGRCTLRLPLNAGGQCTIRATSKARLDLYATSPVFSVRRVNAVRWRAWAFYE